MIHLFANKTNKHFLLENSISNVIINDSPFVRKKVGHSDIQQEFNTRRKIEGILDTRSVGRQRWTLSGTHGK